MNAHLKHVILQQVFESFGIEVIPRTSSHYIHSLKSSEFLLPKKLNFEGEQGKYQNNLWGASAKVETGVIKILIADLSEEVPEYALLIQLDAFPPYAARLSADPQDSGELLFKAENKWIPAHTLFQAKLLVATESLNEILVQWEKLKDYSLLYQILIEFLKVDSGEEQ